MNKLEIVVRKNISDVELIAQVGYCPVECSFGNKSIVDALQMDHHGSMSHLESVAVRAYRDHFGARQEDPRFVVNHVDADCIFAIASLAGLLPHPNSAYAQTLPAFKQKPWLQDLTPLAETIAIIDTDPIGRDIVSMPFGKVLTTWNALFGFGVDDELGAFGAVQGFRQLTAGNPAVLKPYLDAAEESERVRCEAAFADLNERGQKIGGVMVLNRSRVFGFSEWYQRNVQTGGPREAAGWMNPIVVALNAQEALVFGTPNEEVAEEVLGKGGLLNVFAELNKLYNLEPGNGFGGREGIGGSPRGMKMSWEDAQKAAAVINDMISK